MGLIIKKTDDNIYTVGYTETSEVLCKFKNIDLATLFVRYVKGCRLNGHDEYVLREAVKAYEKGKPQIINGQKRVL